MLALCAINIAWMIDASLLHIGTIKCLWSRWYGFTCLQGVCSVNVCEVGGPGRDFCLLRKNRPSVSSANHQRRQKGQRTENLYIESVWKVL